MDGSKKGLTSNERFDSAIIAEHHGLNLQPARTTKHRAAFVFATFLLLTGGNAHAQDSVAADRAALVALYNATSGENWTNNTNWLSNEALSEWHGVETDENGRVTHVYLVLNELSGEIPVELGNLTNLLLLYLWGNELSGEIPAELGNLTSLLYLFLGLNELSGEIPAELGNLTSLLYLFLAINELSGEIPVELGNLTNLLLLHLAQNGLSGEIPEELGKLTNLQRLYLNDNELSGPLPLTLSALSQLSLLDIQETMLCAPADTAFRVWLAPIDFRGALCAAPQLVASGGAVVDGTMLTLTYDEPLDGSSTPVPGDFTVSGGDQARTVTGVRVNGRAVELTLDPGAEHLEAGILVSYTPGTNPIQDVPGNDAEALSRVPVTNETPDTASPAVSSLAITSNPPDNRDTYAIGDVIEATVTFDETVVVTRTPRLRLRVGSRTRTAGYLRGTDTAALVFGYEVADGDEDSDGVSIEAGRIALNGGTIEDEADNDAVLDHEAVATQAGHKVDGVRPELSSAAVDGSSLTLTYREALDPVSRPAAGDFTVEVDGSGRSVTGVSVSGSVVTLTLNPAVEHGDTGIRMSYTPDTNPIRDAVGNEALALSNRSMTNTTSAPNTAPEITSPSSFEVPENQALARRLAARDSDPGDEVTGWEIVGGADQGQFTITTDTGELSFRTAPDYEAPGDNEYEVTVEVRSGVGTRELEAEQTFTLRVTDEREPPGIPEAPTFSGETAESMTVNWSEPDNTGPAITDYDVRYREKDTVDFTDGGHEGPGLSLTLDDLEPGTAYEVQVRATNDEGTSDWSEPGEGMTVTPLTVPMTSDLPPPVESAFAVRFSFSETVVGFTSSDIVTRQEPPCTDSANNSVACNPTIAAFETTDDRIFTTTVTPRTDQVAHNYTLTITVPANTVTSVVGNKPNEEAALEVRIAPPGVTVPISSIGLTANPGNGWVALGWNAPENTGGSAIIRYEYRAAESGGKFNAWMRVDPGERSATVPNLTNGREYVFEVRGVNALGYGPVETAMSTPVKSGPGPIGPGGPLGPVDTTTVPSAPRNLEAVGGDEQVTLSWDAPEDDGGAAISDYEYRIDGRGSWISIDSTRTTHTVTGLFNGTAYIFQVRAVNQIGRSPASDPAEATPRAVVALDFAHFANGAGIISDLVLMNAATHPIRPALHFYDKEGNLLATESVVDVLGDLEITEDGGLTVRTEMEPLGELTISTHGQGEVVSGSVKVVSNGPIGGVLRFDLPGIGVAGVGASPPVRDALFPARRQVGGISTAAAVHNMEEEAIVVSCRLMSGGAVLEEMEISLAAYGQEAQYIEEMFTTVPIRPTSWDRCAAPHRDCSPESRWSWTRATASSPHCRWCR